MKTERSGGSERDSGDVAAAAVFSSHGRARVAPAARRTVLREIVLDIFNPFWNHCSDSEAA
jgi:hypothetical protein